MSADEKRPEDAPPQRVLRGEVKWFDSRKGFGFVLAEGESRDVLLHVNVLRSFGQNSIAEGVGVVLRVQESARGVQAVEVLEISAPTASARGPELPDFALHDLSTLPLQPGRVKWFDRGKGFGFANVWGAPQDVFLHAEVLRRGGFAELQPGEAVALKVVEGPRGRLAAELLPWDSALIRAAEGGRSRAAAGSSAAGDAPSPPAARGAAPVAPDAGGDTDDPADRLEPETGPSERASGSPDPSAGRDRDADSGTAPHTDSPENSGKEQNG